MLKGNGKRNSAQRGVCAIFRTGSMRVNFDLPNCCCCCCCCRSASKITSFAEVAALCFFLFFGCFLVVLFFFLIKCQLCAYGPPMQSVGRQGATSFVAYVVAIYAVSLALCGPPHKSRLHARLNDSCVVILVEPQNCFAHSSTKLCDLRDLCLCLCVPLIPLLVISFTLFSLLIKCRVYANMYTLLAQPSFVVVHVNWQNNVHFPSDFNLRCCRVPPLQALIALVVIIMTRDITCHQHSGDLIFVYDYASELFSTRGAV